MKLATFNIYWLGDDSKVARNKEDNERLAEIIAKLDADALVFQEIVDADVLREILDMADEKTGRRYRMHDAQDRLLGSGGAQDQKVVAAYDAGRYELLAAAPLAGGVNRRPFAMRLRQTADGAQVLVVGVHFQSGFPVFNDQNDADTRRVQCQHIADWAAGRHAGANPALPAPAPGEHVVVLGDFNALYESDEPAYDVVVKSLDPLRQMQADGWWWRKPLADPAGGDRTTSFVEGYLIDHVMLSPSLAGRIRRRPTIYAYDQDPIFFPIRLANVEAYYRLSDHRPVFVELDVSP